MSMETDRTSESEPGALDSSTHLVTLSPTEVQVRVIEGETIVDALRRQGLRTRYKCRRGGCGACRATVIAGKLCYPTTVCQDVVNGGSPPPDEDCTTKCLPCRAVPLSDVHLLLDPSDAVIDVFGTVLPRAGGRTPAEGTPPGPHEGSNPCPS